MKRNYQRDYEFQKKLNERQAEEIKFLKSQIGELTSLCKEKDKIIYSVEPMRKELAENIKEIKEKKKEYNSLVNELKNMRKVMDEEFFKGRWKIVRWIIK